MAIDQPAAPRAVSDGGSEVIFVGFVGLVGPALSEGEIGWPMPDGLKLGWGTTGGGTAGRLGKVATGAAVGVSKGTLLEVGLGVPPSVGSEDGRGNDGPAAAGA